MALHFTTEEFTERQHKTIAQLENRQLDGILMFRQESMYYLSGYDSFGYVFFQCLYLDTDGNLMLLTRAPDLRQARHTSVIEDIRIWQDSAEADPAVQLKQILDEFGCQGKRLGVEYDAYGLTAKNGKLLEAALAGFCDLEDASDLVSRLRVVKARLNWPMYARRPHWRTWPMTKLTAWLNREPTKVTYWRPCRGSFSPMTATIPETNLSSAPAKMHFCADTNQGAASSTPGTS
jgi:hypothetical protein